MEQIRSGAGLRWWSPGGMILLVSAIGLVVAQAIDGVLTATGLIFLDIALPVPLLGRWGLAVGFALVLQAIAVAADLVLANASGLRRSSIMLGAVLFAMVVWCAIQTTVAFLHFTQLTNLTQGEQLTQSLTYAADVVSRRIAAADTEIQRAYHAAVAAQRTMETQSRAGDDQSRIAACGPRCQEAIGMRRQLERRFAVLASDLPGRAGSPAAGMPMVAYAQLVPLIDALKVKSEQYLQLCLMLRDQTCRNPAEAVTQDLAYQRLHRAVAGDQVADRQTLVLWQVERDMSALTSGTLSVRTGFLGLFVLLLPICELAAVLWIRLALLAGRMAVEMDLDELRRQDALLDQRLGFETRIAAKRAFQAIMKRPAGQGAV